MQTETPVQAIECKATNARNRKRHYHTKKLKQSKQAVEMLLQGNIKTTIDFNKFVNSAQVIKSDSHPPYFHCTPKHHTELKSLEDCKDKYDPKVFAKYEEEQQKNGDLPPLQSPHAHELGQLSHPKDSEEYDDSCVWGSMDPKKTIHHAIKLAPKPKNTISMR